MNTSDEWAKLESLWRQDGDRHAEGALAANAPMLAREAEKKQRRMRLAVGAEIALVLVATGFLLLATFVPAFSIFTDERRWWNLLMIAYFWVYEGGLIYLRRADWNIPALSVSELLAFSEQRTRTAIRLAYLNLLGLVPFALLTVPFVVAEWQEVSRQRSLLFLGKVLIPAAVAVVGATLVYLRRQRQKLARIRELRRNLTA